MASIKGKDLEFEKIVEKYNSYVYKIILNESNNKLTKEDIEETISDVFFLLWKNYEKIDDYDKIKSYIGKIAKNTTMNKLRKSKNELSFEENTFSSGKNEEQNYLINEQLKIVHKALGDVDSADKRIFIMYYYENKKVKEIAKLEDIKVSTIKTRLHRTRKKLKKMLEKGGYKNER